MTGIRKAKKAAGQLSAPWLNILGQIFDSPVLHRAALRADPQYLRAVRGAKAGNLANFYMAQLQIAAQLAAEANGYSADRIKKIVGLSEAQFLQDVFCILALDEMRDGFFAEVGVGDGRSLSNTYMLEKQYGWRGILVEPNRSSHETIVQSRTAHLDRRAAASSSGQSLTFQEYLEKGEHSRIARTGGHNLRNEQIQEYEVYTVTLNDALSLVGAPEEPEFLSLDTEGSELDILEGLDLNRFRFKIITIEHNHNQLTINKLRKSLGPIGYRQVLSHISNVDAWFIHESLTCAAFPGIRD